LQLSDFKKWPDQSKHHATIIRWLRGPVLRASQKKMLANAVVSGSRSIASRTSSAHILSAFHSLPFFPPPLASSLVASTRCNNTPPYNYVPSTPRAICFSFSLGSCPWLVVRAEGWRRQSSPVLVPPFFLASVNPFALGDCIVDFGGTTRELPAGLGRES